MAEYINRKILVDLVLSKLKFMGDARIMNQNDEKVLSEIDGYEKAMEAVHELILDRDLIEDVKPVEWISCKDKMPDTSEQGMDSKYSDCCLVCDEFGWIGMGYYITDGQKSWWEFADAQNKNKIDWTEVTHWMPLPEPPKDGEDNE